MVNSPSRWVGFGAQPAGSARPAEFVEMGLGMEEHGDAAPETVPPSILPKGKNLPRRGGPVGTG